MKLRTKNNNNNKKFSKKINPYKKMFSLKKNIQRNIKWKKSFIFYIKKIFFDEIKREREKILKYSKRAKWLEMESFVIYYYYNC